MFFFCFKQNKKNNVYPVNPSFTIKKWGRKGSKLYRHVFMVNTYMDMNFIAIATASQYTLRIVTKQLIQVQQGAMAVVITERSVFITDKLYGHSRRGFENNL